jgi:flavin-dependent dehydrogenase
MAKMRTELDVLVLGSHPCASLAAMLLAQGDVSVRHLSPASPQAPDRLVLINPAFFDLHKSVAPLKRKLDLAAIYGLAFLSDEAKVRSEHSGKSIVGYVASFEQVQREMRRLAEKEKVRAEPIEDFTIDELDESGLTLRAQDKPLHPRLLLLATSVAPEQRRMLGVNEHWERGILHRYTYLTLKSSKGTPAAAKASVLMSLDLAGMLCWAWLLPGRESLQVAVEQPLETVDQKPPDALLKHWIDVLEQQQAIEPGAANSLDEAVSIDLPLAGALAQEGVANRTLLIGPAGGFYTACAEDVYPCCWSATFAVDVARKALKERHLQDALQEYRQKWSTTLGDYLRGPQQNLRFLLPLVYRNPVMTTRLAEAILHGKSVVR